MDEWLDVQFIVYEVSGEKYALRISEVHEIIKLQKITTVHNSRPFVEGVINLRGKIVPVINLHKRFELRPFLPTKFSRIIVIENGGEMVGLLVDRVSEVVEFETVQAVQEAVGAADSSYFEGLGLCGDGVVSLLKIERVLFE